MLRRSLLLLALALGAPVALADTVTLKNGREIHGRLVEESQKTIRMRTEGGGTITIEKSEVATFTEGEVFVVYSRQLTAEEEAKLKELRERGKRPKPGQEPGEEPPPDEAPKPDQPKPADKPAGGWTWAEGLSAEEIEALTPVRDQLLDELKKLGPSAEERRRALEATPAERARIQELMLRFKSRQRQGSANARRAVAKEELAGFGAKAVPALVEALASESQWTQRVAAQALGALAGGAEGVTADEMKWLYQHLDVPTQLLPLLAHQGEIDSPFVRADANGALEAISGQKTGWPAEVTDKLRTPKEGQAADDWARWVRGSKQRFTKREEERVAQRAELEKKLELVRQGKPPEAPATEGEGG